MSAFLSVSTCQEQRRQLLIQQQEQRLQMFEEQRRREAAVAGQQQQATVSHGSPSSYNTGGGLRAMLSESAQEGTSRQTGATFVNCSASRHVRSLENKL